MLKCITSEIKGNKQVFISLTVYALCLTPPTPVWLLPLSPSLPVRSQTLQAAVPDWGRAQGGQQRQAELQVDRGLRSHPLQVGASPGQRQEPGQAAKPGSDRWAPVMGNCSAVTCWFIIPTLCRERARPLFFFLLFFFFFFNSPSPLTDRINATRCRRWDTRLLLLLFFLLHLLSPSSMLLIGWAEAADELKR